MKVFRFSRLLVLPVCIVLLFAGLTQAQEKQKIHQRKMIALEKMRPVRGHVGRIEAPLLDYMEKTGEKELISIVIMMKRQLSDDERKKLYFETGKGEKRAYRKSLARALKNIARREQIHLLEFLRAMEKEGQALHVRPLWLTNAIGAKVTRDVIKKLVELKGVDYLHLDIPRPVKGQEWGVTQINADDVWSLVPTGYDGTGVVVAILDTGVEYTHGDLQNNMWINAAEDINGDGDFTAADNNGVDDDGNGFVDDVVGWNFSGAGSNDPDDVHGHGTHVAGTVAGDGTGGSDTGVAPGASIMALRESNTAVLSTEQECWDGMQYALDNGADIVNFSSGWLDVWAPDYDAWRDSVMNLMDGGVLFVTIAHNDSNTTGAPNNVRTPGRVPLAVTLGATDNTDTIAGFSNHGPITWQTVTPFFDYPWPPGLLKPDVSAPGVNVNSTRRGGGYTTMDGTSMAAPHASGVAALLLDEDPSLTTHELKYLLEENAVDLGATGSDNTYGWGRLDALAAVNDTISGTAYDLSVTGTTALWTSVDIWVDNDDDGNSNIPMALSNNHLYARIRNIGGQVVSNVEVKFYYANVASIGIGGFDPNGDGNPADGNFNYIGSYRVPTMGPAGSDHAEAIALVNWNIPVPTGHWCVGIGIVAPYPPNAAEGDTSNNTAFKNFFNIITSDTAFDFHINPLPKAPEEDFGLELIKKNLPEEAEVEFVIKREFVKRLMVNLEGLELIKEPLLTMKNFPDEYYRILAKDIPYVRYRMAGERAVLNRIVSPKGMPIPARVVIKIPGKAEYNPEMYLIINTIGRKGEAAGGLTLKIHKKRGDWKKH